MTFVKDPLNATNPREIIEYSQDLEDRIGGAIDELIDVFYPVGTIYESTNSKNPSEFMGGVWESYGNGRVTVGFDSSQTEFNSVGKTGGAKTHTLTIGEMPSHNHSGNINIGWGAGGPSSNLRLDENKGMNKVLLNINSSGGNEPHNNLQPYITVYRFRRIA